MKLRSFIKNSLKVSLAILAFPLFAESRDTRPNILLIYTDDHGYNSISSYGSKLNITPNLDRLATEGMRFENAMVSYSLCSPARATVLTGKYAHQHGMYSIPQCFDGSQQTFPKLLQKNGYSTALFGKWHLHSIPTGFDEYGVFLDQGTYFDPDMIVTGATLEKTKGYSTDLVADRSIDWLKQQETKDKPWLLMCQFKSPHYSWDPDEKNKALFKDEKYPHPHNFDQDPSKGKAPNELKVPISTLQEWNHFPEAWAAIMPQGMNAEEQREWNFQTFMRNYLACVASVDSNTGRVLNYLEESGQLDDTLIVYTSDNGMFQGEHGLIDKKFMYEEGLKVPLIVRYPKSIQKGSVSKDFVGNHQIAATFLDYAQIPIPGDLQGRSFRPVLEGNTPADWDQSFYYHFLGTIADRKRGIYGIKTQRYKLIHYYNNMDEWELFDLNSDPQEMHDQYDNPEYAAVIKALKKQIEQKRKSLGVTDQIESEIEHYYENKAELRKKFRTGTYIQYKNKIIDNTRKAGSGADWKK